MNKLTIEQKQAIFDFNNKAVSYLESVREKYEEGKKQIYNSSNSYLSKIWKYIRGNNNKSITVDTIFHDSKVPLNKWCKLIDLILNSESGINLLQVCCTLNLTYESVYAMEKRILDFMLKNRKKINFDITFEDFIEYMFKKKKDENEQL